MYCETQILSDYCTTPNVNKTILHFSPLDLDSTVFIIDPLQVSKTHVDIGPDPV